MEKKGKMTKSEQIRLRQVLAKENGLRRLIEQTSLVAHNLDREKVAVLEEIRKRLNIQRDPLLANTETGELKWNE